MTDDASSSSDERPATPDPTPPAPAAPAAASAPSGAQIAKSRTESPVLVKLAAGVAAAAMVIAMIAASFAIKAYQATTDLQASAAAPTGPAEPSAPQHVVDVELGEMFVRPSTIEVPRGYELVVNVKNVGTMDHDLALEGKEGTALLNPGKEETVSFGVITKDTQAWCTVAGHKQAGMVTNIVVVDPPDEDSSSSSDHDDMTHSTEPSTPATGDDSAGDDSAGDAVIDPAAQPSADWTARDASLAPAPSSKHHDITLEAIDKTIEVSPGVTQRIWTFGGTMPGPVIRGKVGDTFTITLVNKGSIGHSIDFHASERAMDDVMRTIQPGESLVYEFTAEHSGIWMYHCGTPPVLHHIGNGMYGAVIIDPPNLPAVDKEFVFVQSELYLGPEGSEMSMEKMAADKPDAVVFNGYDRQYSFQPIQVAAGDRVRVWVLDAGPSQPSAFHIIGTQFDTVFKEGAYRLRPDSAVQGGAQVLDLQPGSGGFVELTFPEAGHFAFVTHRFVDANRGALGSFVAS